MNVADYACLIRFQAFPFIANEDKRRPIRYLFEMDVQHPAFQRVVTPLIMNNQFTQFCRFLSAAKHHNWMRYPRDARDLEIAEALFWDEPIEPLANRILKTLLHFPHHSAPLIWRSSLNLLLRASNIEEKEASLVLMDAFAS
jgi:hypothetical protein